MTFMSHNVPILKGVLETAGYVVLRWSQLVWTCLICAASGAVTGFFAAGLFL